MGNLRELLGICSQAETNLDDFGSSMEDITKAVTSGAENVNTQIKRIVDTLNVQNDDLKEK